MAFMHPFRCRTVLLASLLLVLFGVGPVNAKSFSELFPDVTFKNPQAQDLVRSFDYRQGIVPLGPSGVQLNVPEQFYFLAPAAAARVLVDVWGNPPVVAEGILGMILPTNKAPVEKTWGVIVTYDEVGYVSDRDVAQMDPVALLASMQEAAAAASKARVDNGFGSIRLLGWVSPPRYDDQAKKLHWAKELQFNDGAHRTVNFDVRALGRRGVLKLNFVAGLADLGRVEALIPVVLAMPEFTAGARYQDYIAGSDKMAAFGIGGLIAGKAQENTRN